MFDLEDKRLILIEIGRIIRNERLKKQITTSEIANDLLLEEYYIELIEIGNINLEVFKQIYLIGYIINISKYLNLDTDLIFNKLGFSDEDMFPDKNINNTLQEIKQISYENIKEDTNEDLNLINLNIKHKLLIFFCAILFLVFLFYNKKTKNANNAKKAETHIIQQFDNDL